MQSTSLANRWHFELTNHETRRLNRLFKVIIWLVVTAFMISSVYNFAQPWVVNIAHHYLILRISLGVLLFSIIGCLNACLLLIIRKCRRSV